MQVNYNRFTLQELERILEAAHTISFAFGIQFSTREEQSKLLREDEQFRAITQIIIQSFNTIRKKYIDINPDAPDFDPDADEAAHGPVEKIILEY
mgnify:CR=1 FL=1